MDPLSGEIFRRQWKQRLASNVLDINNSTGSFHSKASVFSCNSIAGTPSQILSSNPLLFFTFCRMSPNHKHFINNNSKTSQCYYRRLKGILEIMVFTHKSDANHVQ